MTTEAAAIGTQVATTILAQIKHLDMWFIGALNGGVERPMAVNPTEEHMGGIKIRFTNTERNKAGWKSYFLITLNALDYYDIQIVRTRGAKVVTEEVTDMVPWDALVAVMDKEVREEG